MTGEEQKQQKLARHTEYTRGTIEEAGLSPDPFIQFSAWLAGALTSQMDEPMAMTLATCTPDGVPSARIVLIDEYGPAGFTFYTNYESRKGRELAENPRVAAVFFWASLERQVRVEGRVAKLPVEESDAYFQQRPYKSQLAAWASAQSETIESRKILDVQMEQLESRYPVGGVARPAHWGGYRLTPESFEFWQGRPHRLNDRILYEKTENGPWKISRLAP